MGTSERDRIQANKQIQANKHARMTRQRGSLVWPGPIRQAPLPPRALAWVQENEEKARAKPRRPSYKHDWIGGEWKKVR